MGAELVPVAEKATVDRYEQIDVRHLRRGGLLRPGAQFMVGEIQARNTGTTLSLSWKRGSGRGRGSVRLLRTRCNYGGTRKWLQCPAENCGRRVGVLYLRGDSIACRQCLRLAYCSQREELGVRRLRRARAVRLRMGFSADVDSLLGPKPHRMHCKTYDRLRRQYFQLLEQAFGVELKATA
jgi:hypothetical protein